VIDFTVDGQLFGKIFFYIADELLNRNHTFVVKDAFINFSKGTSPEQSFIVVGKSYYLIMCETLHIVIAMCYPF
jgi:hypothetical protein